MSHLTMPTKGTKQWQQRHSDHLAEMKAALKAAGANTPAKRRKLFERAATSRPADLAQQARVSLALRRIAGTGAKP